MNKQKVFISFIVLFVTVLNGIDAKAQQWIKEMPGYDRYREIAPQIRGSVKQGAVTVKWNDDGKSFEYNSDGKKYQFDLKKKKAVETGEPDKEESPMSRYRRMYGNRP